MRFSNAASVDRCATSSFLSTSFSSIHSVPVCLHACMSTHTRFPIIPSPHPPHLLRFSRPSLKHSFRLSLSVSLCFLSSFSSFYHIFPTHQSSLRSFVFLLPPTLFPLFLLFSRAPFFSHSFFVCSLTILLPSQFSVYPLLFRTVFTPLVTVEFAPSNSALPTNFFSPFHFLH